MTFEGGIFSNRVHCFFRRALSRYSLCSILLVAIFGGLCAVSDFISHVVQW